MYSGNPAGDHAKDMTEAMQRSYEITVQQRMRELRIDRMLAEYLVNMEMRLAKLEQGN